MNVQETWPISPDEPKDASQKILQAMGLEASEYELGKTKVFIKDAKTLFALEKLRAKRMPLVQTAISRKYRY